MLAGGMRAGVTRGHGVTPVNEAMSGPPCPRAVGSRGMKQPPTSRSTTPWQQQASPLVPAHQRQRVGHQGVWQVEQAWRAGKLLGSSSHRGMPFSKDLHDCLLCNTTAAGGSGGGGSERSCR